MKNLEIFLERIRKNDWFSKTIDKVAISYVWIWQSLLAVAFLAAGISILGIQQDLGWIAIPAFAGSVLLVVFQAVSAFLLHKGNYRGRSIAIIGNVVAIALFSFAAFQISNMISLFDVMSQSFFNSFFGLLVLLSGIAWWVVAVRVIRRLDPEDLSTLNKAGRSFQLKVIYFFKRIGQALTVVGSIFFLVQFNPFWMIGLAVSSLFFPNPTAFLCVGLAFFASIQLRALLSPSVSLKLKATQSEEERLTGWLFVSPSIIGFLAFLAGPLAYSFVMSFFKWDGINTPTFIGLDNYTNTLGLEFAATRESLSTGYFQIAELFGLSVGALDPLFWKSITNILVFLLTAVPLSVIIALILATLIEQRLPGSKVFRAVFFIPSVAGVIGVTLIWKQMLNSSVGFINYAIGETFSILNFFLPGDPLPTRVEIGWLSTEQFALAAVVIVFVWSQFGFNTVLYIAGLQSVSKELYEAAELDGATSFQRFWNVTLPALRPTTFFITATTVILAMQLFDIVFALNSPNVVGFPNNATLTPVVYLYQLGFQQNSFGKASAVAWILFAIIFVFTLLQFNRQRQQAEGN
jgi:ABC-type sugar transport system permease subunit